MGASKLGRHEGGQAQRAQTEKKGAEVAAVLRLRFTEKSQSEREQSEREHGQSPSPKIDAALGVRALGLRYKAQGERQSEGGEGWAQRGGDGRRTGPEADRLTSHRLRKTRRYDGQALGDEQSCSYPLKRPPENEAQGPGRCRTRKGGEGEQTDPSNEHPPSAHEIPEAAPYENQASEQQGVGIRNPLNRAEGSLEVSLHAGQRDIHHRAVDEGEGGGDDRGSEHERSVSFLAGLFGPHREGFPTVGAKRAVDAGKGGGRSGFGHPRTSFAPTLLKSRAAMVLGALGDEGAILRARKDVRCGWIWAAVFLLLGLGCSEGTLGLKTDGEQEDEGPDEKACEPTPLLGFWSLPGYHLADAQIEMGRVPRPGMIGSVDPVARDFGPDLVHSPGGECCTDVLCVHAAVGVRPEVPKDFERTLLRLALTSGAMPPDPPPPVTLILLDGSSSLLAEESRALMQTALRTFVDGLDDASQLGLMVFRGEPELTVPFGSASERRDTVVRSSADLVSTGPTNIGFALFAGLDRVLEAARAEGRMARVLLITDGMDGQTPFYLENWKPQLRPYIAEGVDLSIYQVATAPSAWLQDLTSWAAGTLVATTDDEAVETWMQEEAKARPQVLARDVRFRVEGPVTFGPSMGWAYRERSTGEPPEIDIPVLLVEGRTLRAPLANIPGGAMTLTEVNSGSSPGSAEIELELSYRLGPMGSPRVRHLQQVALPEGWPSVRSDQGATDFVTAEAVVAWHAAQIYRIALGRWSDTYDPRGAIEDMAELVWSLQIHPLAETDPDVAADLRRAQTILRFMGGRPEDTNWRPPDTLWTQPTDPE